MLERIVEKVSRLPFPYEVVQGKESFLKMQALLKENRGILVLMNHFSKRDAIQGFQIVLRNLSPYSRKTVIPIAKHQLKPSMAKVLGSLGMEAYPIAGFNAQALKDAAREIPQSERRAFFINAEKEYADYLKNAEDALNYGGLVGLLPQATREPRLGVPKTYAITKLFERTNVNRNNVFIVCIGIGFAKETDYSDPKFWDYNLGAKFVVRVGNVFDLKEISGNVDEWVHEQLRTLVPSEYV